MDNERIVPNISDVPIKISGWSVHTWHRLSELHYHNEIELLTCRGGRISAATAFVGGVLGIKPVLHMDIEGHLINKFKVRGRRAAINALADKLGELMTDKSQGPVFICHGDCIADAQYLEKLVKEKCGVKNVFIGYTGAVIGSHSGPGTLALFFLGGKR